MLSSTEFRNVNVVTLHQECRSFIGLVPDADDLVLGWQEQGAGLRKIMANVFINVGLWDGAIL